VQLGTTGDRPYIYGAGGTGATGNYYIDNGIDTGLIAGNICDASGQAGCTIVSAGSCFFVNAGAGNFHHCTTSPAIDAGVTLASPYNVDLDGNTRTAPFDVGAYEGAGRPGPPPPAAARVVGAATLDPWSRLGVLNTATPVVRQHPLLSVMHHWWRVTAGLEGGTRLWDLLGGQHATFGAMTPPTGGWGPTSRRGGDGEIRFDGTSQVAITYDGSVAQSSGSASGWMAWM
jgi:hypothetical protein